MRMYPVITLFDFLEESIKSLGDPAYQERVWINHQGKEVDDYDEATMNFMYRCEDILNHPDNYEGMDSTIQAALQKLYDGVCKFDDEIADEFPDGKESEMIQTPEWHAIQKLATETYETIKSNLKERNYEREY